MAAPCLQQVSFEHYSIGSIVGVAAPRISWRFSYDEHTAQNWKQISYDIEVASTEHQNAVVYQIQSEASSLIPWPAEPLRSRARAVVRVRCHGTTNVPQSNTLVTPWSEPAVLEIGLLQRDDWTARFITSESDLESNRSLRPLRFSKTFVLPARNSAPKAARLYVTAHGVFDAYMNTKPVTDEHLAPGWTSYHHRLNYRAVDVTSLLLPGSENVIGIEVGEGWYAGRLGFHGGSRFCYGNQLATVAQLEVIFDDNSCWTLETNETWTCDQSPILWSSIYDGETYDHGQDFAWTDPSHTSQADKSAPLKVSSLSWPESRFVLPQAPPVRIVDKVSPQSIFLSKSGKTILDFGQNLVGKLLIKSVLLDPGQELVIKHAEVMENEELGTRPLRDARNTDTVLGSGRLLENWSPRFTFHGFRYAEITGWPEGSQPTANDIAALVISSDLRRRGKFNCSNRMVNRLHNNVVWSMKGNFVSIPTDCPQRDERMGWTGDIQVFSPTASFLYDTIGMLGEWLEDVSAEQLADGMNGIPPLVVPNVMPSSWPHMPQAIWDDVVVLLPEVLHKYSADNAILERQLSSMLAWLDKGLSRDTDGLWNPDWLQLGDWLDPIAPPDNPGAARTDGVLVANAYLVRVTKALADICKILGKSELASKYSQDTQRLKTRFQQKYISPDGNVMSNSQTGIALALRGDLYDGPKQLETAAASLNRLVRLEKFLISTGFAGTPEILPALTATGQTQLAYRMLLEKNCPSWMYPVSMGATTIWERWDSMLPTGEINPGDMTSFNHYALGAVADWLHTTVGGLSPLEPGWKSFRVRPIPGGNLTSAEVSFDGPYGMIACAWKYNQDDGEFDMTLTVPPNSSAVVILPSKQNTSLGCDLQTEGITVGSGYYDYHCVFVAEPWPPKAITHPMAPPLPDSIAV